MNIELWGDIGFLVFTFSSIIFTLLYLTLSRWYKSFMGSLIAVFMVGVGILSAYLALRIWDVQLPNVELMRLIIFWILGLSMVAAVVGFLEIQFGRRARNLRKRLAEKYDDIE